jgi:hypothetical protein
MNNIQQMMRDRPMVALDLLTKLLDTSDGALKTRDRLLSELSQELQDMSVLEEKHLFPVLRKHKDMKDLVRNAVDDNKETKSLLADLERTPRDSEEFGKKVVILRKTFQQHVRDEKKELLPAIVKALSDEEAASVIETMDGSKAEIEGSRNAEAEQRRTQARKDPRPAKRPETSRTKHLNKSVSGARQAGARTIERAASETTEAIQKGGDQVVHGLSRAVEEAVEVTQRASDDWRAMSMSGEALGRGLQSISREWFELSQARMQQNLNDMSAVFRSRTFPEMVAAQNSLLRHNLEMMVENGQRIMSLSMRMVEKIKPPLANSSGQGR